MSLINCKVNLIECVIVYTDTANQGAIFKIT